MGREEEERGWEGGEGGGERRGEEGEGQNRWVDRGRRWRSQ